jgi:enoyl-CoA hydratase/3-hydroxyacyl-CoA dehydrogenase
MGDSSVRLAVVGAGNMGSGIALKLAMEGREVLLRDTAESHLSAGLGRIARSLDEAVERKIVAPSGRDEILGRIKAGTGLEGLARCRLVIEAIYEDLAVKRQLFAAMDEACPPEVLLATNTSSLRVATLAEGLAHPERVMGLHFFFPPLKNKLVEVVSADRTDPAMARGAWELMAATGKIPIAAKDAPGFCVNRFFIPWYNEAVRVLDGAGASLEDIEATAREAFGVTMGPFELMNATLHAAMGLGDALGAFYEPARGLRERSASGKDWDLSYAPRGVVRPGVAERLFAVVWLVVGQILDERVAAPKDVDLGAKAGLRWARGPIESMRDAGQEKVLSAVAALAGRHPGLRVPASLETLLRNGDG